MCFFLAIGGDPKGLKLAVVNDEAGNCDFGNNTGYISFDPVNLSCSYTDLSCTYLHAFDDSIAEKVRKLIKCMHKSYIHIFLIS